jgi:hypothetical protein
VKIQQKALLIGGLAGAMLGLAAAFLYLKANEAQIAAVEAGESDAVGDVSPGEALTVGLSIVGLLRQISSMGQPKA